MGNSANVSFNVIDQTGGVQEAQTDVVYVMGPTLRGPLNNPKDIIYTSRQFKEVFGGFFSQLTSPNFTSMFPNYCLAMLDAGVKLRVCRIDNYSDYSDPTTQESQKPDGNGLYWLSLDGAITVGTTIKIKVGTSTITVPYNTSESTTLTDLKSAIEAVSGHTVTVVHSSTSDHVYLWKVSKSSGNPIIEIVTGNTYTGISAISGNAIITSGGLVIGYISPKSTGSSNDGITVAISGISGKESTHYKITVTDSYTGVTEVFDDLYHTNDLIANYTAQNLLVDCLKDINLKSNLIVIEGITELSFTDVPSPIAVSYNFGGGQDGNAPELGAYVGSLQGKLGAYAFNEYEDSFILAIPDLEYSIASTPGFFDQMAGYCKLRKDMVYLQHIPVEDSDTVSNVINYIKAQTSGVISDGALIGGGLEVNLLPTNTQVKVSELPFVIANMVKSHKENGIWISPTNSSNGVIPQAKAVQRNFGSVAVFEELNSIANAGGNMVINRGGVIMLWDDYTPLRESSQLQFLNVVLLTKFIKRSLRPGLEKFLGKPNTFITWERMYYYNLPFLEKLVKKNALYGFEWKGDQFAQKMTDLQINNADDVSLGKYKIELVLKPIPPLKEIVVNIMVTKAGVSFE